MVRGYLSLDKLIESPSGSEPPVLTSDPSALQPGAGELDPRRPPGDPDLQGAPAPLLPGEGGLQQGQGLPQAHGAGERAQHQAVEPSGLQVALRCSGEQTNTPRRVGRGGATPALRFLSTWPRFLV